MLRRHEISDDFLPGQKNDLAVTVKHNRLLINPILWIATTGAPGAHLPQRFGNWNSVWRRCSRWPTKGVCQRVLGQFQDPDQQWLLLDSNVIRAHRHGPGAKKG